MRSKKTFLTIFSILILFILLSILHPPQLTETAPPANVSGEGKVNNPSMHENLEKGMSLKEINLSTIENVILRKEEIRSVIEEYEGVSYEFINNSTLKMFVQTPCADYFVVYDFVNDSVISIDKTTIGKKTIKEEAVSEEERQRFLAIALNDSRVKEALKGRNFSVRIVKYVMYAACQKARDPDSVHMMFRVDSELYRVFLFPYKDELEVVRVERIV
jgi:hypothetical protein